MSVYLRVGPNRTVIQDTEFIGAVELSYSLKDVFNYGKRNSSFSKPITIYRTKETDAIFQGLHNINIVNGFNIGQKVYGELVENGIPILIGNIQVTDITPSTIEIILSTNNISLFEDIADKLIVGNTNGGDDTVFPASSTQIDKILLSGFNGHCEFGTELGVKEVDWDTNLETTCDVAIATFAADWLSINHVIASKEVVGSDVYLVFTGYQDGFSFGTVVHRTSGSLGGTVFSTPGFNLCQHTYDVSTVRGYLNTTPPATGTGLMYGVIDYSNTLVAPTDIKTEYPIFPGIALKQLFDRILTDAGYAYELGTDISTLLNKMYIPYNGTLNSGSGTTADISYGYYFCGSPIDVAQPLGFDIQLSSTLSYMPDGEVIPYGCFRGFCLSNPGKISPPICPSANGGYDLLAQRVSTFHSGDSNIGLPKAGTYTIDISILVYNRLSSSSSRDMVFFYYQLWNDVDKSQNGDIELSLDVLPTDYAYISKTIEVTVSKPSSFRIYMFSNKYPYSAVNSAFVRPVFGQWKVAHDGVRGETSVKIALKNYPYAIPATVNLNVIRPLNYRKSDLINDVLKMFNAYIEVDPNNEKYL